MRPLYCTWTEAAQLRRSGQGMACTSDHHHDHQHTYGWNGQRHSTAQRSRSLNCVQSCGRERWRPHTCLHSIDGWPPGRPAGSPRWPPARQRAARTMACKKVRSLCTQVRRTQLFHRITRTRVRTANPRSFVPCHTHSKRE